MRILGMLLVMGVSYISCGKSSQNTTPTISLPLESSLTPRDIPVNVIQNTGKLNLIDKSGLGLVAPGGVGADSFVISLVNCSSGLTGTNSSQSVLHVYLNDANCLAKLSSFVLHSQSYVPTGTGSSPFTTWLAGDTAIFRGASNTDLVNVKVVSQLSSPIQISDVVSYEFTILTAGTNSASISLASNLTITSVGQDAPNFQLSSGNAFLSGIASSGAGIFTFKLTCDSGTMSVGANPSYNSFCSTTTGSPNGVDVGVVNQFSYILIADPNGNGTLTLAQAQSAFAGGGDTTVNLATDILPGSTGFQTQPLTGPGPLSTNLKLILILQSKNPNFPTNTAYSSFQYFPITLPSSN